MATARVWLITGASRGLGRAFAEAALVNGDRVVAVARNIEPLGDLAEKYPGHLAPLSMDVADRQGVFDGVARAAAAFGRLDVVVNNAGGMLYGMVEEATEEQVRAHMDVNFFGAVWVAQAVLPHLRAQGGGRLLQVTSMGSGGGMATVGYYGAGKAALDSVSEALAMEVEGFGIKVTIVQMGGYNTGLFTTGTTNTESLAQYQPLRTEMEAMWGDTVAPEPDTAAPVIMKLAALPDPPRRLIVGSQSFDHVLEMDRAQADLYRSWEHLSRMAPG
ncbi:MULTISPECIES: SDR family NAD(P)-dependent oxidoreductase [unclassified Streptomyces]|uniref:SDR family NAD(P)-dependent oxidoreductase n=1 Tax=unclassified Streptomyces TaxID=2593676 RepID=UPI001369D701|nr:MULTISPECIES: SDR family NAD(P)-dependent oxidoreductase [unclassified Streptomyces]NEA04216.1 SDR family NAD(P)-dependent oxidoreductase [Streptomyces sp. SID10116]MYY80126.1 SDR family NAD(P)-dependent oxidoreductase [Streptomyces sp. SID335]MYZ18414.1 SDR family NAD(P)-dependent oxidoreductase [Streptomyces sp. SID337]NDZ85342.1 SDR family NAD(P)-dependent oxidoreductase [Streptomyces sp. SID10115]NEB46548.1 SDR family NAD(P)-dependent oxidoreductase [Streptomyces sp. SID339]